MEVNVKYSLVIWFANWKITMFKNGKIIINDSMIYKCAVFHSYVK